MYPRHISRREPPQVAAAPAGGNGGETGAGNVVQLPVTLRQARVSGDVALGGARSRPARRAANRLRLVAQRLWQWPETRGTFAAQRLFAIFMAVTFVALFERYLQ